MERQETAGGARALQAVGNDPTFPQADNMRVFPPPVHDALNLDSLLTPDERLVRDKVRNFMVSTAGRASGVLVRPTSAQRATARASAAQQGPTTACNPMPTIRPSCISRPKTRTPPPLPPPCSSHPLDPPPCMQVTRVAPVIADYWERAEFPFPLVPDFAKLNLAGGNIRGYGCPVRQAPRRGCLTEFTRAGLQSVWRGHTPALQQGVVMQ